MRRLNEAIDKLEQGRLKEGQAILEQLRRERPDDAMVLYNLGMCYSEQGRLKPSIEALERCIELAPDFVNAYAALGFSYKRNGQPDEAIEVLEAGRQKDPDNLFVLKNLGATYGDQGCLDEAVECFKLASESDPDNPEILYGLAYAYERQGRIDEADPIYRRLIETAGPRRLVSLAKEARTRIGVDTLKAKGVRVDAVWYCLAALEKYEEMSRSEVQTIVLEIALLGQGGLDINDPDRKYRIKSLPGEFSGLQLLCYMYVGFQRIDASVDIGADLSDEYQAALSIHGGEVIET